MMCNEIATIKIPQWVSIRTAYVLEQSIEDSEELLSIHERLVTTLGTHTQKDAAITKFHSDHIKDCEELLQHYKK